MDAGEQNDKEADGRVNLDQRYPPLDRRPPQEIASFEGILKTSPHKKDSSPLKNSIYPDCQPAALCASANSQHGEMAKALGANSQQTEMTKYFQGCTECYEQQNRFCLDSQEETPPTLRRNEHRADEPTEEGLLFEDSTYGDEISRWMEDQRRLQQQQLANGQVQQRGNGDDSSIVITEHTTEVLSNDGAKKNNGASESATCPGAPSKRPASEISKSSSSQKLSSKRRQRSLSASQVASSDDRTPSRRRMDEAINERTQSQIALRDALSSLEKAKAVVNRCRSRYNAAKVHVLTTAKEECNSLLQEDTPWNEMFHKLKQYKDETGDCNVKQNFGAENIKNSPEMVRKLSSWVGKQRKDGKLRGRGASVACKSNEGTHDGKASEESDLENALAVSLDEKANVSSDVFHDNEDHAGSSSVFDDVDPDTIHADPYKEIALDGIGFDWDPRNSRWNNMYEELRRYKDEHGNTLVPHANFGLGAWVKRQQVQYTLYIKGDGAKSELSDERVRLLNDLGFIWSRRTNTWNENFQRLVKWKNHNGSIHIPDDSKDPELATLHKWVADQRVHYKRQIADEEGNCSDDPNTIDRKGCEEKSNGSDGNHGNTAMKKKGKRKLPKLSHDKIAKLQSIGFEFDSRDAKWLQKLDVLLKYKQSQGDFLVPSTYPEDPTLSNWVASQRAQYKLYMKGSKSHMTERRLKILTDAGFPFSVNEVRQKVKKEAAYQDRVQFDEKPWLEKYKDFLLYIATYGNLETLQKNNPFLAKWAFQQREKCSSLERAAAIKDEGCASNNPESKEQNAILIEAAYFFSFSLSNKASALVLRGKYFEASSTNKDDSSWDDQFGNLAAWYIKNGTYALKGMPPKMKRFLLKQQEQYCLFTAGLGSELNSERIEKLEDIYFPFDKATLKDPREEDATSSRRNRSWEEYRLDLAISYIQQGNYDSNSMNDMELRRWASEQKRQHKLFLAGKQTTLSFAQIQKLIDIKFISKRPKQKSWSENCADLMAFRIQFGSFNVASAHVVASAKGMPSKGKSANSCTSNTALKNLQEWVVKLQGHREYSKSVSTNDELSQDQKMKLDSVGFPWTGSWTTNQELPDDFSRLLKQQEMAVAQAEGSTSVTPIKSNLFGMTLEIGDAAST